MVTASRLVPALAALVLPDDTEAQLSPLARLIGETGPGRLLPGTDWDALVN